MGQGDREVTRRSCEALQAEFFADRALIIAANRGPVAFERDEDGTLGIYRLRALCLSGRRHAKLRDASLRTLAASGARSTA